MTLLMALIIVTSGGNPFLSQNKKSTYYYPRYNRNKTIKLPVIATSEQFGWSFLVSDSKLTSSFFQRDIIRSFFLQKNHLPDFDSVIKTFKLNPESGDGRFLLQFYLYLTGKSFKLPPEDGIPSSRSNMLSFFNSLKKGDLSEMETKLYGLGATNHQLLKFILRLAIKLKTHGFLERSYSLFRRGLRIVETQGYSLKIPNREKQRWYRFLVIHMAEISHKEGKYRKAWGILKWWNKSTPGSFLEKIDCSYEEIFSDNCKTSSTKQKRVSIKTSKETSMYHKALIEWSNNWKNGQKSFNKFLKFHPTSPWKKPTEKFIFWLKFNTK
jgi:hypothetical protein